MYGLLLWVEAEKKRKAYKAIAELRKTCDKCNGIGYQTYGSGGSNGYGYSMHQMPCSKCGYLEMTYAIHGEVPTTLDYNRNTPLQDLGI